MIPFYELVFEFLRWKSVAALLRADYDDLLNLGKRGTSSPIWAGF